MTRVYFVYWQTLFDNSVFVFLGCFAVLLPMLEKKLPLQDSLNQAFTEGMCMHRAKRGCRSSFLSVHLNYNMLQIHYRIFAQ